jgi:hypothetical protein
MPLAVEGRDGIGDLGGKAGGAAKFAQRAPFREFGGDALTGAVKSGVEPVVFLLVLRAR